jgi:hypothetical protein
MAMNKALFKRIQIAGLFIISFLGGLVHLALHSHVAEAGLFSWAGNLMEVLRTPGAGLPLAAGVAELPEFEFMSGGMLYIAVLWFTLLIVPAILPLLTDRKGWRWVTAIVGLVMALMGVFDGLVHMSSPGEAAMGLSGLIIGSIPGIIAVVLAFGWARGKEEAE